MQINFKIKITIKIKRKYHLLPKKILFLNNKTKFYSLEIKERIKQ